MKSTENTNKMPPVNRSSVDAIPDQYLGIISHTLLGFNNTTLDYREPHIRPALANVYWIFVTLYGVLIVVGTMSNIGMIIHVARVHLYRDPTYCFLLNIALCDIIKCAIALPITLMVLLIQNWVFGQFLCFFLPMLQDIPIHISMMSFLLIAVDRYHLIRNPMKPRLPAFVFALGTWFLAACIVMPYPIYITYIDLGMYAKFHLEGVGICAYNLIDDIQEYIRPLFLVMYVAPLSSIAYCYIRISRELKVQDGPLTVMMYEPRSHDASTRSRTDSHSTADFRSDYEGSTRGSQYSRNSYRPRFELYEGELDIYKEKRTQRYLTLMVTAFAACLFPLMILRLARLAIIETYENTGHLDITFLLIVWIAFLPTCSTPWLFMFWHMNRLTKERLQNCYRFGHRKLNPSTDAVSTFASVTSGGVIREHIPDVINGDSFLSNNHGDRSSISSVQRSTLTLESRERMNSTPTYIAVPGGYRHHGSRGSRGSHGSEGRPSMDTQISYQVDFST